MRSTQLELYTLCSGTMTATTGAVAVAEHLQLTSSCQLFGVVESVAVLRGGAHGQLDALMLTFRCMHSTMWAGSEAQWCCWGRGCLCMLQCVWLAELWPVPVPLLPCTIPADYPLCPTCVPSLPPIYPAQGCQAVCAALGCGPPRARPQQLALLRGGPLTQAGAYPIPTPPPGCHRWAWLGQWAYGYVAS